MKLIKLTSILLCFLMIAAMFAGCDTPEESKADVTSKDSLLNTSEDISETVSEEISEEVSQALGFVIVDKRGEQSEWNDIVDTFYTDEDYKYSFPNWDMHKYVIVEYEDGTIQNVKEALEAGYIVITDLDIFNIEYLKSPIEE